MLRFFSQPTTGSAIDRLAAAQQLSVFVGAGASKEVGFPTWGELVIRLGRSVIPESLADTTDGRAIDEFIQNSGALAAAERVAGSLTSTQLRDRIHEALYGNDAPGSMLPGPLVRAAADLKATNADKVHLVTTNYDQLLVQAMRDAGLGNAKSYCTATTKTQAVIHLHGVVGFAKPADGLNEIVLTERDFLAPEAGGWRRDVVKKALNGGPCLFVGVSLTDLNLLRPLHDSHSNNRHVVIYTRAAEMTPTATAEVERIESARWEKLNVECLFADNYADSSVFVREVARRRRSDEGTGFVQRLRAWHNDVVMPFTPASPLDYETIQQELSSTLHGLLVAIQASHGMDGEVMQLGLFAFGLDGDAEYATVLATSDRVMKDPRSIERIPLQRQTEWTGIKTMCTGVPVYEPKHTYASRWKHMLAVPTCLDSLSGASIGAVVLSSTDPDSRLNRVTSTGLMTNEYSDLFGALQEAGRNVLSTAS
jgi:hypothetical protein